MDRRCFFIGGNQGDEWELAEVSLAAYVGQVVNIRFRGVSGSDYRSDIAIDDIMLSHPPIANFDYGVQNDGVTISFTDLSLFSDTITFDLGDGTVMGSVPSSYTYASQQVYSVTQTVSNTVGEDTLLKLITTLDLQKVDESGITIYPNPTSDILIIENLNGQNSIHLYDMSGSLIQEYSAVGKSHISLNLVELEAGNYLIHIDDSMTFPLTIVR